MEIKVKSIKVLKKGENDYGEWKLVQVTTSEDVKYTTLAKEAETITLGSIINIKDMDKDDKGRESFKKYEVVERGEAEKPPSEMTPELWTEKDRLQRFSIESQVCFKGIVELAKQPIMDDPQTLKVYRAALDWAMAHFKTTFKQGEDKAIEQAKPSKVEQEEEDEGTVIEEKQKDILEADEPATIQALYNWIVSHGSKEYTRTWFLKTFSYTEEELKKPSRVLDAYHEIKETMGW